MKAPAVLGLAVVVLVSLVRYGPAGAASPTAGRTTEPGPGQSTCEAELSDGGCPRPSAGRAHGLFSPPTLLQPVADLAITLTDAPDPVPLGGRLVYLVTVTNVGPQSASGVTVTDRLPSESGWFPPGPVRGAARRPGRY